MSLITYDEDQSDMLLKAIEEGFVQIDPRLIVDLEPHFEAEAVLQWCNEQWEGLQVITCIATYCQEHDYGRPYKSREYHYVSRYFFKDVDHAMLFKLVFSDGLYKIPASSYQLFLR